jgi:hypothetical protein
MGLYVPADGLTQFGRELATCQSHPMVASVGGISTANAL